MEHICKTCIMPEGYQGSFLDNEGICNHCRVYFKYEKELNDFKNLDKIFDKIINKYKNKGSYDCMLLFSGGKDSSYVLHRLIEKHKLKVLVFTYDWGFQSDTANKNSSNIVNKLDVELIKYSPESSFLREMRKQFVINRGIAEFCRPCMKQIMSASFRFAQEHNIPIIIKALSRAQALCDTVGIYWFHNLISKIDEFKEEDLYAHYYAHLVYEELLRRTLSPDIFTKAIYNLKENVKIPLMLPYFAFYEYDESLIRSTIKDVLGWEEPLHAKNLLDHTDCEVSLATEYLYSKTYGVSRRRRELAFLVRSGKLERDTALDMERKSLEMKEPNEQLNLLFEYLQLSNKEKVNCMSTKSTKHYDYVRDFSRVKLLRD